MIGGIFQIALLLLPVILAYYARKNSPAELQSNRNKEIDNAIAKNDADAVTLQLNDMLGKLRNDKNGRDPRG